MTTIALDMCFRLCYLPRQDVIGAFVFLYSAD